MKNTLSPKRGCSKITSMCCLGLCLSTANLHAQANGVTLSVSNERVENVITQLKKNTPYKFFYSPEVLEHASNVSINVKNKSIDEILKSIEDQTALEFKRDNKTISISLNEAEVKVAKQQNPQNSQEKKTIKGKVLDASKNPVVGASVFVIGSKKVVTTDMNGAFELKNLSPDSKVRISCIGYKTTELKGNDPSLAAVTLNLVSSELNEVVVVGYGSQKKVNVTGAVATIDADEINNRPVSTAAGALQGADPSVNLNFSSGALDSGYSIDIRGVASVNGGSPLILCDGMEISLNQINPNDIESISILKDASASAIYGAKASSGVVLITTKSGKDSGGKVNVNYNGRFAWKKNTTSTDFINTGFDHVNIVNKFYQSYQGKLMWGYEDEDLAMLEARRNDKHENADRPWAVMQDGKLKFYANFDWHDYLYKHVRPEQEHNLTITGGNKKLNYYVSGRFFDQDGIFKIYNDEYKNYSFRTKVNAELFPFLRWSGNVNFNYTDYKYAGYHDEQMTIHSLQSNLNSAVMPYTPEGKTVAYVNTMTGANSPLGAGHAGFLTANQARNSRGKKDLIISNQFDVDIFKDLVLTASYAYRYRKGQTNHRSMPYNYVDKNGYEKTFTSGSITDYYQEIHQDIYHHSLNIFGTYSHTWNNSHNFKAVAGMQYEDHRLTELDVRKNDLLSNDLSSMSLATGDAIVGQNISQYRTLGYFARVNYDYRGKYLFEASGRFDGSSRFASSDRWGFFPSASLGWRISEEDFWKSLSPVWNNAKIRFSVGSLGNQQVPNYAYYDKIYTDKTMDYTVDGISKGYYASASSPISSSLTWETVTTYNWGFDFGFLNNRLTASADIFIRQTKDMLTHALTLPDVFGAETPKQNCADLRTNGWELSIGWKDYFKLGNHDFEYGVTATIGDYQSTITKFNNPDKLISDFYEGKKLGEIWGYKTDGLFATDEEAAAYQAKINDRIVNQRVYNSKKDNHLMAGDVKFVDLDGNGRIDQGAGTVDNPGDMRVIGNSLPRFSYSFRLNASYVGFDVSAFFQGIGKCDWFPSTYAYDFWGPYSFPSLSFIHKDFEENCWTPENTDGYFPRERGYQSYSGGALSVPTDRYLQNAAYLRLKNLTVGYTLPIKKNKVLKSLRVYFTGENLWYTSPMKKHSKTVDPEMAHASSYKDGSGVAYGYSKSFSFGLDVNF